MNRHECTDHEGRTYECLKDMLAAHHITRQTFHNRMKKGMPLKEALETPAKEGPCPKPCTDHKGNEYPSKTARASHYRMSRQVLDARLEKGMPLKDALETPARTRRPSTSANGKETAHG